jgi:type II secretion system protein G
MQGNLTRRRAASGFTLIELMVVVAALGILAAIAVPKMTNQINKAKAARTIAIVKSVQFAMRNYNQDTGSWPPQFAYPWNTNGLMTQPAGVTGWSGPYLQKWYPTAWGGSMDIIRSLDCDGNGINELLLYLNEDTSIAANDNKAQIPMDMMTFIDKSLDNGDLNTGNVYGNGYCSSAPGEMVVIIQKDAG